MIMKARELEELFSRHNATDLEWNGRCHDCGAPVQIIASISDDGGGVSITGGAIYKPAAEFFYKCDGCFAKEKNLKDYQTCEVYSRVVGYYRPVKNWHQGKQAEFKTLKMFDVEMFEKEFE
jgi:hypothetical protein